MSEVKAILFDADGVVITSKEPFSHQYAKEKGFDPSEITPFFAGDFQDALIGKADLRDLLEKHRDLWRWDGSVDGLMQQWFEAENLFDEQLVQEIGRLSAQGVKCFLATNQEKYRAAHLGEVMFPGVFERVYSSATVRAKKPDVNYYNFILEEIAKEGILTDEIVYFDDDAENVKAAQQLGIHAVLYRDINDLHDTLHERGVA